MDVDTFLDVLVNEGVITLHSDAAKQQLEDCRRFMKIRTNNGECTRSEMWDAFQLWARCPKCA